MISQAQPKEIKKIDVKHCDFMRFDEKLAPGAQRLIGNVVFEHEGMIMTCDSAYYYSTDNTLNAFSRVFITKQDGSVKINGDFGKYQGNIKFAEIWDHVVLEDADATMKTQHLYYDLNTNIAYYLNGAEIFNKGNDMVSKLGYYHRNINQFYFKKDVVLHTPDYTIITDTLDYNVHTKIADFVGPTDINNKTNDSIYCERGWYNTNDTVALFRQHAWLKSGSTTVWSDTLYYENTTGNGRAFRNIKIIDTTNNVILRGHKGEFHKPTEIAWLTDSALLIMANAEDSIYLHADTLRSVVDTLGFKVMKAYNKVRFYNHDMQGKCDSMAISLQDTIIRMYVEPVIWAQDNQMTAEYIEVETHNQKVTRLNMVNKGFVASREDTVGFNQLRGKKIVGLIRDGKDLYRINAYDDCETVYYVRDGLDITGSNKLTSKLVQIDIKDRQVQRVKNMVNVEGELIPVTEFSPQELTLLGFQWLEKYRPTDRNDIFTQDFDSRILASSKKKTVKDTLAVHETLDSLRLRIKKSIRNYQAEIGVAVMGFKDRDTMTINNTMYPTMSVYKHHVALSVLRYIDFGRLRMDQKVMVTPEDLHPDTYSPLRDAYPKGNVEITIAELLRYMVSESDNNACDILFKLMNGPKRVEQIVKSMGLSDITIAATEDEMHKDLEKQYANLTTPYSAVKALELLFRQDMLSESSRTYLWKIMVSTTTGPDKIKGNLPSTITVGHKTGSSFRLEDGVKPADNDIGIVRLPNEQHFMIAVFVANSKEDDKTNAEIIADIAKLAYDYFSVK